MTQMVSNIRRHCVICGCPTDIAVWVCPYCVARYGLNGPEGDWPNGIRKLLERHRGLVSREQEMGAYERVTQWLSGITERERITATGQRTCLDCGRVVPKERAYCECHDDYAGDGLVEFKCEVCGQIIRIPDPEENYPNWAILYVGADYEGSEPEFCPNCGTRLDDMVTWPYPPFVSDDDTNE